jgi:hypothetical protein
MYHLIVSGNANELTGEPFVLSADRVVAKSEYTDASIAERLGALDSPSLSELLTFPAVFAHEYGVNVPARLGRITGVRKRGGEVRVEYEFIPGMPSIPMDALESAVWELDIGQFELFRTHWAIKAPDLAEALVKAEILAPEQAATLRATTLARTETEERVATLVAPTVFTVPSTPRQVDLVAVMMPFKPEFEATWEAIRRAAADAGLRCLRASDTWNDSVLVQDIFTLLWESTIVVADFSEKNPNVMYETGIAHTLGRPVVPITRTDEDVPFDLRHHRYLRYVPNDEGLRGMQVALANRLRTLVPRGAI